MIAQGISMHWEGFLVALLWDIFSNIWGVEQMLMMMMMMMFFHDSSWLWNLFSLPVFFFRLSNSAPKTASMDPQRIPDIPGFPGLSQTIHGLTSPGALGRRLVYDLHGGWFPWPSVIPLFLFNVQKSSCCNYCRNYYYFRRFTFKDEFSIWWHCEKMWVFPKIVVPQNGWFIMETPIRMDDLGGTTIFGNTHVDLVKVTKRFCWHKSRFWKIWGSRGRKASKNSEALEKEFRLAKAPWRIGDPCKMSSSKAFPAVHCQERYG